MDEILIIGHSYVRDLKIRSGGFINNARCKFLYLPGSCFRHYDEHFFTRISRRGSYKYVFVVLGGNSLVRDLDFRMMREEITTFYELLNLSFSNSKIVPIEVEMRFYKEDNKWDALPEDKFKIVRNALNRFIRTAKFGHHYLQIGGPSRMDNADFYKSDGVHLNNLGLDKYISLISNFLDSLN